MSQDVHYDEEMEVAEITFEAAPDKTVDRVVIETPDVHTGQFTFKPRTDGKRTEEMLGAPFEFNEPQRLPIKEFAAEWEELMEAVDALDEGKTVKITASVTEWDQSDEEGDSDATYFYVDRSNADSITVEIEE